MASVVYKCSGYDVAHVETLSSTDRLMSKLKENLELYQEMCNSNRNISFVDKKYQKSLSEEESFRSTHFRNIRMSTLEKRHIVKPLMLDYSFEELEHKLDNNLWTRASASLSVESFQIPQTPIVGSISSEFGNISSPISTRTVITQDYEELQNGENGKLFLKDFDELKDGSFLFVMTENVENLVSILNERGLEVQDIGKTRTPKVLAVLFKTHEFAKRAFITQRDMCIRMVPHNCTIRNWWKNPSPKYHVTFETKTRLTLKGGKCVDKMVVGDFLMLDARRQRGCTIWADQMKGNRLRVVGYVGKFRYSNGHIVEKHTPPSVEERRVLGWISTKCKKTKKNFVQRMTGNKVEDYIYDKGEH